VLAPQKKGPQVGTVGDPFRHRTYSYESEAERTVITVIGSFPSVVAIDVFRRGIRALTHSR